MMPQAMPGASSQAMPQTSPSNARYATLRTQLTQRVQDMGDNTYVPDAAEAVDKGVSSRSRRPCACGCGFIAHGEFVVGHRLDNIRPAGMVIDRALLIAIAVYDGLPAREQDAWLVAKSRLEARRAS